MVIRSSSTSEVERLLRNLRDGTPVERDAAIARLRVIGTRALEAVATIAASSTETAAARIAALQAMDGVGDRRALQAALAAVSAENGSVAAAGLAVLGHWAVHDAEGDVLDVLTRTALDPARSAPVRLAALDALSSLPDSVVRPLFQQVSADVAPHVSENDTNDPLQAREWLSSNPGAPLSKIHALIVRAGEQERRENQPAARRQDWLITRGEAHARLAARGSRVALYDLKESFDASRSPLPLDFLTAITAIGDASSLEPLARAWAATPTETWWRERLSEAAGDIMHRTRLSGRSGVVKRIRSKYHGFV